MNKDDIIRMAQEAGVYSGANEMVFAASLERFADLVAAHEREACAKVCDEWVEDHAKTADCTYADCDFVAAATDCAAAIRARGEQ